MIYYVRRAHGVIWMLTMYPKNVADNIPAHVLRQIRKEVEVLRRKRNVGRGTAWMDYAKSNVASTVV